MTKEYKVKKDIISTRTVLWYVVFTGFAVNYMTRVNLNIAIVSMIKIKTRTNVIVISSECLGNDSTSTILRSSTINQNETCLTCNTDDSLNITSFTSEGKVIEKLENEADKFEGFAWNEFHQGLILGAYFWFHWLTQIPGGILAQKYGTKLVFGISNYMGVLLCFFIPVASYLGYEYLSFLRAVQGLLTGFAWPSMHHMAGKWIPPNERSSFVSAYLGSSVGAALTYPMCGWIIDKWGWEWVFYSNGLLGTLWYVWWCLCVFDSPEQHPRISEVEREYILSRLEVQTKSIKKPPVPWKEIFTSIPIWMNILAQWGGIWGFFTLMTHAPMYFKLIHGWDIKATGFLSGMPHLLRFGFALLFSQLGDYLLESNKMSRTNVRKLAVTHCCTIQGLFMLGLAYSGCNYTVAIIFLSAAVAVNGAVSTGPLASLVDISPNYASIGLGMCNTIVALVGVIIPTTVSYITYENQTVGQWQKVFWLATGMLLVSGFFYVIFQTSEVQPWNSPIANVEDEELKTLNKTEVIESHEKTVLELIDKEKFLEGTNK